eukprot:scaffold52973_cov45-Phaeocystis_antarctica.AAC.2
MRVPDLTLTVQHIGRHLPAAQEVGAVFREDGRAQGLAGRARGQALSGWEHGIACGKGGVKPGWQGGVARHAAMQGKWGVHREAHIVPEGVLAAVLVVE